MAHPSPLTTRLGYIADVKPPPYEQLSAERETLLSIVRQRVTEVCSSLQELYIPLGFCSLYGQAVHPSATSLRDSLGSLCAQFRKPHKNRDHYPELMEGLIERTKELRALVAKSAFGPSTEGGDTQGEPLLMPELRRSHTTLTESVNGELTRITGLVRPSTSSTTLFFNIETFCHPNVLALLSG